MLAMSHAEMAPWNLEWFGKPAMLM
jgi:hypothetical protein